MHSNGNEQIIFCIDTNCTNPLEEGRLGMNLNQINLWLGGVTQSAIACVGIFGNLISIIIFGCTKLRNTFHMFLVMLAVWDLGYLILTLAEEVLDMYDIKNQGKSFHHPDYVPTNLFFILYPKFIHPFKPIFLMASEYFTVVISLDRYFAIMHPFRYYSFFNIHPSNTSFLDDNQQKRRNVSKGMKANYLWIGLYIPLLYLYFPFAIVYLCSLNTKQIKQVEI